MSRNIEAIVLLFHLDPDVFSDECSYTGRSFSTMYVFTVLTDEMIQALAAHQAPEPKNFSCMVRRDALLQLSIQLEAFVCNRILVFLTALFTHCNTLLGPLILSLTNGGVNTSCLMNSHPSQNTITLLICGTTL